MTAAGMYAVTTDVCLDCRTPLDLPTLTPTLCRECAHVADGYGGEAARIALLLTYRARLAAHARGEHCDACGTTDYPHRDHSTPQGRR